jgi:hypothetical protein
MIFGPEFGTGTEGSIFSKKESEPNQTKPKLVSWFFKELELELEPASGILKTNWWKKLVCVPVISFCKIFIPSYAFEEEEEGNNKKVQLCKSLSS